MPQSKSRKIAILGYRSVGKSSLTIQFVEGQFVDSYDPTIENTFTKLLTVNGQEYHLQLVDTAGQDEYSIFPQTYSIDINGYILVYSVTSIKSFEVIKVIHGKLLDMVGKVQIPIMLVGNKKDLHMERSVHGHVCQGSNVAALVLGRSRLSPARQVFLSRRESSHPVQSRLSKTVGDQLRRREGVSRILECSLFGIFC
ncbi:GTP-binding protein Rheb isoform X1 [Molossus molossus]|uniref:GTP-binding protein Rheb isoform X1 n=1 Tax=Molossus molossus TaxID=27622 RepID=UPI0017476C10|nr:GTP-binding protein Rheb isoform X1 [Molossus molossus]